VALVRPLKDSDEGYEEPIDPVVDGLSSRGFYPQNTVDAEDEAAGIERDDDGNLILKDEDAGEVPLSSLCTARQVAESLGNSTTTGTDYVNKVALTTPSVPVGTRYLIDWYCELSASAANRQPGVRCRVNDSVDLGEVTLRPSAGALFEQFSGCREFVSTSAGPQVVRIDFRRDGGSSATITIRRAAITLRRVG